MMMQPVDSQRNHSLEYYSCRVQREQYMHKFVISIRALLYRILTHGADICIDMPGSHLLIIYRFVAAWHDKKNKSNVALKVQCHRR